MSLGKCKFESQHLTRTKLFALKNEKFIQASMCLCVCAMWEKPKRFECLCGFHLANQSVAVLIACFVCWSFVKFCACAFKNYFQLYVSVSCQISLCPSQYSFTLFFLFFKNCLRVCFFSNIKIAVRSSKIQICHLRFWSLFPSLRV